MLSATVRKREEEDDNQDNVFIPSFKKAKVDLANADDASEAVKVGIAGSQDASDVSGSILPPSHILLGVPTPSSSIDGYSSQILETDVGISEYIGRDVPPMNGIIKQRFTDFLVYEVNLDHQVIHVKSLAIPASSKKSDEHPVTSEGDADATHTTPSDFPTGTVKGNETIPLAVVEDEFGVAPADLHVDRASKDKGNQKEEVIEDVEQGLWGERHDSALAPFFAGAALAQLKQMYLEGPEPPRVSDNGWASRQSKASDTGESMEPQDHDDPELKEGKGRGEGRDGRGGRGARGGRGGSRGGRAGGGREDNRKVISEPISSKTTRTALHKVIRELFAGKLDSETDTSTPAGDDGSCIVIRWSRSGGGRGGGRGGRSGRGGKGERVPRGTYPPYIHFTLQKTNRDTQDALAHLSRLLHVNIKDLAVAGTKDKRGVTVQRVSLRRGNKTVEDVWKLASNIGRRSIEEALTQRGERGVRIADLNYRKASLELGLLKGNHFIITLRNVQVDSAETVDRALNTLKHKGFINYYGMQRFGTAAVPTHSIGLALLKSDWHKAVSLILQKRPGEHPDVLAARKAWLDDHDLDRALELMPRRVIAERCILESYKKQKGETRNAMGALSTIPRNLRLMYIHAYQSYVWNAIVSERIRVYGADKPIVGDLIFEKDTGNVSEDADIAVEGTEGDPLADGKEELDGAADDTEIGSGSRRKATKSWEPPRVKTLTEHDINKHSIFDVIMPLPGTDVAYPGGPLGERYREFLRMDGLDPENFVRKQKEYTLGGSYRKILQMPKDLSWSVLRYTDPDVALAQSDEDKLLGFDPPAVVEDGKFLALQIRLTLGTAAYATMALREVTKTETSSHFQTGLTQASEDQKYRGTADELGGDT